MRAGSMHEQITWQSATVSQDSHGQPIETWGSVPSDATVWADIQSAGAGERFISGAEQRQSEITHKVRIRYRTDLTVQMRGLWGSRYLYIENVLDPDGRKAELLVMCREVQF